jgi:O-methyltransferase
LFDSFEGLPEVKEIDGPDAQIWQSNTNGIDYFDNCKADINDARTAMIRSGAKQYTINKGWFNETLKTFSFPEGIAILRLDADWYDSTMDCLVNLFPRINKGGILILDDYYTWEGCSKAIHDYLSTHKLPYRIHSVHGICYLIKQ